VRERRLIKTATSPFYIYLAYHNVHGAVNVPSATLQVTQRPLAASLCARGCWVFTPVWRRRRALPSISTTGPTSTHVQSTAALLSAGVAQQVSRCRCADKVAGGMLTKLDDGVGAVQAALEAAAAPYILAFAADNGGPLDHATNAPLKGGKHTLWVRFPHCLIGWLWLA